MMTPLFRWNGAFWGFLQDGFIFDLHRNYYGWVDNEQRAWRKDGEYFGELLDGCYILRKNSSGSWEPVRTKIPPIPKRGVHYEDRPYRLPREGWTDPLP